MISIIIPVYNSEKYLNKCIDSVLSQNYNDFELILVNDGSTDRSGEICEEYFRKDKRVTVINQDNRGVSAARNSGLNNARGEWVAFIDSDDYIGDDFLKEFNLTSYHADFYLQGYTILDNNNLKSNTFVDDYSGKLNSVFFAYAEQNNIFNSPVCKLFKHELIEKYNIRFDLNTSFGEDHIFVLDYLRYIEFVFTSNGKSYVYNKVHNSLTNRLVPYKQLEYYTLKILDLQSKFENILKDEQVSRSINIRLYGNTIRVLKSFFKSNSSSIENYNKLILNFCPVIKKRMKGIKFYQKIIYTFFMFPEFISYYIFKLLTKY